MPLALIMSSHVAASRVGGTVQALAFSALGIDPVMVPTVLYGRHPGWGAPGGAAVSAEVFEAMLEGVQANGLFGLADVVITGYFASAAQVRAAARAIDAVRASGRSGSYSPRATIIVDPIMGDAGKGLYVPTEVAEAIASELVGRADLISPNAWELERLAGGPVRDANAAVEVGRRLGRPILISSIPDGDDMGVVYADANEAWLAAHSRAPRAPAGTGDLLAALYATAVVEKLSPRDALARAVGGVVETVNAANAWGSPELPVVAMGTRIGKGSPSVRIERSA